MAGWLPQEVHGIVRGAASAGAAPKGPISPSLTETHKSYRPPREYNTYVLAVVQQGLALLTCCTGDDGEACQDTIQATKHHSLQKISLIAVCLIVKLARSCVVK